MQVKIIVNRRKIYKMFRFVLLIWVVAMCVGLYGYAKADTTTADYIDIPSSECTLHRLQDNYGTIASPNYPDHYPDNLCEIWEIQPMSSSNILLTMIDFGTEECCDFVEIEHDGNITWHRSGELNLTSEFPIKLSLPIRIKLITDHSVKSRGFKAFYQSATDECGSNTALTARQQVDISSPEFPLSYTNNAVCSWVFRVRPDHILYLEVLHFETDDGYDKLMMSDAENTNVLSGHIEQSIYIYITAIVFLTFTSDHSVTNIGFQIRISEGVIDGGEEYYHSECTLHRLQDNYGTIASANYPDHYPDNLCEIWEIQPMSSSNILLTMIDFGTEECCDFVEIEHDGNIIWHRSGELNLTSEFPIKLSLPIIIKLITDHSVESRGFKAFYQSAADECGSNTALTPRQQVDISSPEFPLSYSNNAVCSWVFRVRPDHTLKLEVLHFETEDGYDKLMISDAENTNVLSGHIEPFIYIYNTAIVFLTFTSDHSVINIGFQIRLSEDVNDGGEHYYQCEGCDAETLLHNTNPGLVNSPGYPDNDYPPDSSCKWTITRSIGSYTLLTIIELDLEQSYDFLRISYNGIIDSYTGSNDNVVGSSFSSRDPSMDIEFTSDGSQQLRGFAVYMQPGFEGPQCGSTSPLEVQGPGYINSPAMSPQSKSSACSWVLQTSAGNYIVLRSLAYPQPPVSGDLLWISDGRNTINAFVEPFDQFNSAGRFIFITFIFQPSSNTSFTFEFEHISGGVINNGEASCLGRCEETHPSLGSTNCYCNQYCWEDNNGCCPDFQMQCRPSCRDYCGSEHPFLNCSCGPSCDDIDIHCCQPEYLEECTSLILSPDCELFTHDNSNLGIIRPHLDNGEYLNNECMEWVVNRTKGDGTLLSIVRFDVEHKYDFVEISGGGNISRYTGYFEPDNEFALRMDSVTVRFQSDYSVVRPGFIFVYQPTSSNCQHIIQHPSNTTAYNMNLPLPIPTPGASLCSWAIKINESSYVNMHVHLFRPNAYQYLEVSDGLGQHRISSHQEDRIFEFRTRYLFITFVSDDNSQASAFNITYSAVSNGCFKYRNEAFGEDVSCCPEEFGYQKPGCINIIWNGSICTDNGLGNPALYGGPREFFQSLTLSDVRKSMDGIYQASQEKNSEATKACFGNLDQIRVMDRDRDTTLDGYGRVEILVQNSWQTVCDDGFDETSAKVLCAHLGHSFGQVRSDAFFGRGNGGVFLSGIECDDDDTKLYQCILRVDLERTCTHAEDVSVICSLENHNDTSYFGYDTSGSSSASLYQDDTVNAIFIPNIIEGIAREGNLTEWTFYFNSSDVEVHLQVWRPKFKDIYELVGQTTARFASSKQENPYRKQLDTSEYIAVNTGDVIGFYFPTENPIPWIGKTCFEGEEQLRYIYRPASAPEIKQLYEFKTAPLAWQPCRSYLFGCTIFNKPVDSAETVDENNEPTNAVFFEDFEEESTLKFQRVNDITEPWRVTSGPTESIGTGPESAAQGNYYLYHEASNSSPVKMLSNAIRFDASPSNQSLFCVSFYYFMYGQHIGNLSLTLVRESSETREPNVPFFQRNETTQSKWIWFQKMVPVSFLSGRLLLESNHYGFMGDIAIDNITIIRGKCLEQPTIVQSETRLDQIYFLYRNREQDTSTRIAYVRFPSASTLSGEARNCTSPMPCGRIEDVWRSPNENVTIIFTTTVPRTWILNVSLIPEQVFHLRLFANVSDQNSRDNQGLPIVSLHIVNSNNRCFASFAAINVKLDGTLVMVCVVNNIPIHIKNTIYIENTHLQNVTINVIRSKQLALDVKNSIAINSFLSLEAESSTATVKDSTMISQLPANETLPTTRTLGLHMAYPDNVGSHHLSIENCIFTGLYQRNGKTFPSAAITLTNKNTNSVVKVVIMNSTFQNNERAVDFQVKGNIDISILNSYFTNNHAEGSGGAVRISSHLEQGLGAISYVKKARLRIDKTLFVNNLARTASIYDASDVYYQSYSPGIGGALYVSLAVPSQLLRDGLVSILNSIFQNNTADLQGGTIYINPEISVELISSTLSNVDNLISFRPNVGDILYLSSNSTMVNVTFNVTTTDGSAPIISYQAVDTTNYRLNTDTVTFVCPQGFWIDQLNTTSFSQLGASALESLQLYCRPCELNMYSLNVSKSILSGIRADIFNVVNCTQCPYGASCNKGILNNDGFWGVANTEDRLVEMYPCPEEYCKQRSTVSISYDSCADFRYGVLCGHCKEGYSESFFGTTCLSNEVCGLQNWWILLFLLVYGILYIFFFMFQGDWERFLSWVSKKVRRRRQGTTSDQKSIQSFQSTDNSDIGSSGYFQIFMYFVQTSALLKIQIVITEDDTYRQIHRPQDILPPFLRNGIIKLLSLDFNFLEERTCLFPDMTVVSKTMAKLIYVGYLFVFVLFLYLATIGCCVFLPVKKRPKLGPFSHNTRIITTILSLFLYTYQSIAEDALLLLNCVKVDGNNVLFYDGNVQCLQEWQYAVISLVVVFVIPFFTILLFGPKLLERKRIGIVFFLFSCVFPLFMCVFIFILYWKEYKIICDEEEQKIYSGNRSNESKRDFSSIPRPHLRSDVKSADDTHGELKHIDMEEEEVNCCCGDTKEIRDEIVDFLVGPYRNDIFKGVCYEGVLNFRRMVMVVLFTFLTDALLRLIALSLTCFLILLLHLKVKPFRQSYSNYIETIALSLLLVMSGTNMIKAAFYQSHTIPRGTNYLVIVIYEWLEAICFGMLPVCIIGVILLAMCFKTGTRFATKIKHSSKTNLNGCGTDVEGENNSMKSHSRPRKNIDSPRSTYGHLRQPSSRPGNQYHYYPNTHESQNSVLRRPKQIMEVPLFSPALRYPYFKSYPNREEESESFRKRKRYDADLHSHWTAPNEQRTRSSWNNTPRQRVIRRLRRVILTDIKT